MTVRQPFARLTSSPAVLAVAVVFALNGAALAGWFSRIPDVKAKFALDNAGLGTVLLGLPLGSILGMVMAGWACRRFGAGPVTWSAILVHGLALIAPALAPTAILVFIGLLVLGGANGVVDVAMNAHAEALERRTGKRFLAACHAMWSLGTATGAVVGIAVVWLGMSLSGHLVAVGVLLSLVAIPLRRGFQPSPPVQGRAREPRAWRIPIPTLRHLALAALMLIAYVGEGAVADWSAVRLRTLPDVEPSFALLGYACFAITMTVGRLLADDWSERFGDRTVLRLGGLAAALGMTVGATASFLPLAVAGFALMGIGCAGLVPIIFRAAAQSPGLSPSAGVAVAASAGYGGFLAAPPLIGWISTWIGLPAVLGGVGSGYLLISLGSVLVARRRANTLC